MPERRKEGFVDAGAPDPPAFYFELSLVGRTEEQTRRVRDQAAGLLDRYGTSERAIIGQSFRTIRDAADARLLKPDGPNVFIIRVTPDPTDPIAHIEDDRGTVVAHALSLAADEDPVMAALWRRVADGFEYLAFGTRITGYRQA